MKRVLFLAALFTAGTAFAWGDDVYVNGHFRQDGSYVQPHVRSAPNNSMFDNYSTQGNTNPYTGQSGRLSPYGSSFGGGTYGTGSTGSRRRGW
ncbi:MAG: hypothetical protein HQL56_18710 [Magnetococcales bacterium]|nr:hypothetical protein [Magnetococcales bacterium]